MRQINRNGFTLIELMLAMSISLVVMGAIFVTYNSQSKSYVAQEHLSAMQQNLRAGMFVLGRELRMAGYDQFPKVDKGSDLVDNDCDGFVDEAGESIGIQEARVDYIRFTLDMHDNLDNDGDGQTDEPDEIGSVNGRSCEAGENIAYSMYVNGEGVQCLGRNTGGGRQAVAEYIEAVNFVYLDEDGNKLDDDGDGGVVASIPDIRSVQIAIVARSQKSEPDVKDMSIYRNLRGEAVISAVGDHFRRQILNMEIRCRNLGVAQKLKDLEEG